MSIQQIIKRVLEKNSWGLYFKVTPLIEMPLNGQPSSYKLYDIHISELEGAISDEIRLTVEEINREGAAECQKKEGSEEM